MGYEMEAQTLSNDLRHEQTDLKNERFIAVFNEVF